MSFAADLFIRAVPGSHVQLECGKVPTNREEAVEELKAIFAESFVIGQIDTRQEEMTSDDWGDGLPSDVYGGEVLFTSTLKVDMDLGDFPFDVQTIALRFYQQYDRKYKLVSAASFWESGSSSLYAAPVSTTPSVLISEEWDLHAPLLKIGLTLPQETISAYSQFSVLMPLSRKGGAYAGRFMVLMAAMSLAAMMPMLIPDMSAGEMLSYEVGLLFAVVAFQLLVSSFLPVSSTISVLDKYGVFLFVFVFVCMVAITLQAHLHQEGSDLAHEFKMLSAWLLCGWSIFHILFVAQIVRTLKHSHTKLITYTEPPVSPGYIVHDGEANTMASSGALSRVRGPHRRGKVTTL